MLITLIDSTSHNIFLVSYNYESNEVTYTAIGSSLWSGPLKSGQVKMIQTEFGAAQYFSVPDMLEWLISGKSQETLSIDTYLKTQSYASHSTWEDSILVGGYSIYSLPCSVWILLIWCRDFIPECRKMPKYCSKLCFLYSNFALSDLIIAKQVDNLSQLLEICLKSKGKVSNDLCFS